MTTIQRSLLNVPLLVMLAGCPTGKEPPLPTLLTDPVPAGAYLLGEDSSLQCKNSSDCDSLRSYGGAPLSQLIGLVSYIPVAKVQIDTPFRLEVHEVTNFQYRFCVEAGVCTPPARTTLAAVSSDGNTEVEVVDYYGSETYNDYPVVWITLQQAKSYCAFIGRRLPTEAEWEIAARGDKRRIYPWTGRKDPACKNMPYKGSSCTELFPLAAIAATDDVTPGDEASRMMHLGGNVREWVEGNWDPYAYCKDRRPCAKGDEANCTKSCQDPEKKEPSVAICEPGVFDPSRTSQSVDSHRGVTRGGSYKLSACYRRLFVRRSAVKTEAKADIGLRCAADKR